MGKIVDTFFITGCPRVYTSSVLVGYLCAFLLQRQDIKYCFFDQWVKEYQVVSSSCLHFVCASVHIVITYRTLPFNSSLKKLINHGHSKNKCEYFQQNNITECYKMLVNMGNEMIEIVLL